MQPDVLFPDLETRGVDEAPGGVDVYVSGFPCQPFSVAGKLRGSSDPRGVLWCKVVEYIIQKRPRAFILENVANLLKFPVIFTFIIDALRGAFDGRGPNSYFVEWKILSTNIHGGIPQSRSRLYIVGLLRGKMNSPFFWPPPARRIKKLCEILQDDIGAETLISDLSETKRNNLLKLLARVDNNADVIADLAGSSLVFMRDMCPCLTASHTSDGAFWSVRRRRLLSTEELMALQGMHASAFKNWESVLSKRSMGKVIGNAMSVCVLERVLRGVLVSLGWACKPDRWA